MGVLVVRPGVDCGWHHIQSRPGLCDERVRPRIVVNPPCDHFVLDEVNLELGGKGRFGRTWGHEVAELKVEVRGLCALRVEKGEPCFDVEGFELDGRHSKVVHVEVIQHSDVVILIQERN